MNNTNDYQEFYENPFIKTIAGNERWTVSDSDKVPIDMYIYMYQKRITGAIYYDQDSLTTLENVCKELPDAKNNTYYLDVIQDNYVILDIEPTCPDDIKEKLLKLPYIYGETSMSGKGYHLVLPTPDCFSEYPAATKKKALKEKHKWYEILLNHFVTFTRNTLPPSIGTESFEPVFRELAEVQIETTRTDIVLTEIQEPDTKFTETIMSKLNYCGRLYKKTLDDFGNDHSRYEFAYIAHLYWNLRKLMDVSWIKNDHIYTKEEQAWFLYTTASDLLKPRIKHESTRDGLPWLLYLTREVMAKSNPQEKTEKN